MSYTEIYVVPMEGPLYSIAECRNAHRGGMLLWRNLWFKYVPGRRFPFFDDKDWDELWALWKREDIPDCDRIAL